MGRLCPHKIQLNLTTMARVKASLFDRMVNPFLKTTKNKLIFPKIYPQLLAKGNNGSGPTSKLVGYASVGYLGEKVMPILDSTHILATDTHYFPLAASACGLSIGLFGRILSDARDVDFETSGSHSAWRLNEDGALVHQEEFQRPQFKSTLEDGTVVSLDASLNNGDVVSHMMPWWWSGPHETHTIEKVSKLAIGLASVDVMIYTNNLGFGLATFMAGETVLHATKGADWLLGSRYEEKHLQVVK